MTKRTAPNPTRALMRSGSGLALTFLIASALAATPARAQIFTANAGVNSPELPALIELLSYRSFEKVHEARSLFQLVYSPLPTLETRLTIPTIYRDLEFTPSAGSTEHDSLFGLGDVELRLKYSLFQDDDVLESTRWAAMVEGIAPTGDDDATAGGVELPRRLQLGTGGWGVGVGTAFTVIRDRHRFSAELFYRHRTRHDGFRLGDSYHANLAYWYRITPSVFDANEEEVEVRGVFELLSTLRTDSVGIAGGLGDGGHEIWVAPGVQIYLSRDILIEAAVQIPISQDVDDAFGRRKWGATLGIKFIF